MEGLGIAKITLASAFAGLLLSGATAHAEDVLGTVPATDVAPSADHVRSNTEPPRFDPNSGEAIRARKQAAAEAKLAPPKPVATRPVPRTAAVAPAPAPGGDAPARPSRAATPAPPVATQPATRESTTAQVTATPFGHPVTATPFTAPSAAAPAGAPVTATPSGAPVTATPSSAANWVDPFVGRPARGNAAASGSVTATSPVTPSTATPGDQPEPASRFGTDTVGAAATTPAAPAATPAPTAPADIDATGSNRRNELAPRVIGVDSMGNSSGGAPPAAAPGDVEPAPASTAPSARPAAPTGGLEDAPLPPSFENDGAPVAP